MSRTESIRLLCGSLVGFWLWISPVVVAAQSPAAVPVGEAKNVAEPVVMLPLAKPADKAPVVRTVDFSAAVEGYSRAKGVAMDKSMRAALEYCGLGAGSKISYRQVGPGILEITASESYFRNLTGALESVACGCKQIVIGIRMIGVSKEILDQLSRDLPGGWSTGALSGMGEVVRSGSVDSPANPFQLPSHKKNAGDANDASAKKTQFVSAVTKSVRATPCRYAKLDADATKELVKSLHGQQAARIMTAPKVTMFPNSDAVIEDVSQRPFVVSVKPVVGPSATAMEPVIEVLKEGLSIALNVELSDGAVHLASEVSMSRILEVDTFTFVPEGAKEEVTVQLPMQEIKKVALDQRLDDGMTLLVSPQFYKDSERVAKQGLFRRDNKIVTREYTLVLLTPTVIDAADEQFLSGNSLSAR